MTLLELTPDHELIPTLPFRPYRNAMLRQARQFLPGADEPQVKHVQTPWGETLVCKAGDYMVYEAEAPEDRWPVAREIFEKSYLEVRPGYYVKRPLTYLVPLEEITRNGDEMVIVHTLEGTVTVRSGDFYLARGIQGEIWPYPKEKADSVLVPAEVVESE